MINLLEKIFQDNNFEIQEGVSQKFTAVKKGFLAILEDKERGKYNYYFVIEVDDIDIFIVKDNNPNSYRKLFEYLKSLEIYSPYFDKNLSLLIVWKVSNLDISELDTKENVPFRRYISDIEENPYFFKKQVMLIPENDVAVVSDGFNTNKDNYVKFIQSVISDTVRFKAFATRHNNGLSDEVVEYAFIAKLYEKLPFLDLEVTESNQETLQNKIGGSLSEQQLMECEKLLQLDDKNLNVWIAEILKEEVDD